MSNTLIVLRQQLQAMANPALQQSSQRFFKESVKMYGIKTPDVITLAKKSFKTIQDQSKTEIWQLCEQLWQSGYLEESFIACQLCYLLRKQYDETDWSVFEKWIDNYVTNWASCDTFCNHSVGTFVEMYPRFVQQLKKWAYAKNLWLRRAGAVTLIIPARKGLFLPDIFAIADILLQDEEDLVQKGYGWLLKAASQAHQQEVFDYVMAHKQAMPRTALRYAIEKMPPELKAQAMKKE